MNRTISMRYRNLNLRMLVAMTAAAALLVSCAKHGPGAITPSGASGSGHLKLDGSIQLDRDFAVKDCWISRPGASFLNGYDLSIASDQVIQSGGVVVKNYSRDGIFNISPKDFFSALTLNLRASASLPKGAVISSARGSTLQVTIRNDGREGAALFKNWIERTVNPRGVWGTLKWTCASVRRS